MRYIENDIEREKRETGIDFNLCLKLYSCIRWTGNVRDFNKEKSKEKEKEIYKEREKRETG